MDPQCDDYFLPMVRIAEMYRRCGFDSERAWLWLTNMYWRGEFEQFARSCKYYPMTPRREMLAVWRDYDHPRIHFSYDEIPIDYYLDGTIKVDLRENIVLPEQTEAWTDQHCYDAYRILAHVDPSDVAPECMAGLMCQFVGSYELLAVCEEAAHDPPPFWRPFKPPPKKIDRQSFAQLVSWFQSRIAAHERVTKQQLYDEAVTKYSIASPAAIDRVWALAPPPWKSRGRPPGSRNRH